MRTPICSAINRKQVINFYYHGGFRLVEPFCLGEIMPGDNESLLCYQVNGHSEFGNPIGWKLFRFSEISNLEVTDEYFTGVRPGYDPDALEMTTIYCCVSTNADDVNKLKESTKLEKSSKGERLPYDQHKKYTPPALKHNEHMRRFRLSHFIFR